MPALRCDAGYEAERVRLQCGHPKRCTECVQELWIRRLYSLGAGDTQGESPPRGHDDPHEAVTVLVLTAYRDWPMPHGQLALPGCSPEAVRTLQQHL
jgi:hypothetical protein